MSPRLGIGRSDRIFGSAGWLAAALLLAACAPSLPARRPDGPPIQSWLAPSPPPEAAASSLPPREAPPGPVLAPGDLLSIGVFRQPELHLEGRISPAGRVTFPLLGPVTAAGRTPEDLERFLRDELSRDFLKDPQVSVAVKEYAPRRVYVVGAVSRPGGYDLAPAGRLTLLQAISGAAGFTDRAYKESARIVRRRGPGERAVLSVSIREIERELARGNAEADVELWPDDLVLIPSGARTAYVLGAVHRPGPFEIPVDGTVTVSMAVSQGGSYTKFAATSSILVLRRTPGGEERSMGVDLDAVLDGRLDLDLPLEPGDVVWVPERGIF